MSNVILVYFSGVYKISGTMTLGNYRGYVCIYFSSFQNSTHRRLKETYEPQFEKFVFYKYDTLFLTMTIPP
jgi:hypothetical protein